VSFPLTSSSRATSVAWAVFEFQTDLQLIRIDVVLLVLALRLRREEFDPLVELDLDLFIHLAARLAAATIARAHCPPGGEPFDIDRFDRHESLPH